MLTFIPTCSPKIGESSEFRVQSRSSDEEILDAEADLITERLALRRLNLGEVAHAVENFARSR